jgi:transcriptional regulator with XRE-family HTH domain
MTPAVLLRKARRDAGITQEQLATRLGISQPVVARLERPDANPRWETLTRALRELGYGIQLTPLTDAGVELDLGQLRERLAMTPGERLRTFQASQASLEELRTRARRSA